MRNTDLTKEKRLAHIKDHLDGGFNIERLVSNVQNRAGDPLACTMRLSSHALAQAMLSWFDERNLAKLKQYCYVAASLDRHWYLMEVDQTSPGANFLQLLKPLVSNNRSLIQWFAYYDDGYDQKRIENHKTHDFWAYQGVLAVRGDWRRLRERSEKILNNPPTTTEKKYLIDHHFYLALSTGDKRGMEEALQAILSPKVVKGRAIDESGFTEDLIFTPAVIYAKIAWLHGYEVSVNSDLVPPEWLPITPLDTYEKGYDFLSEG
ncbi:hypothetical protein J2S30_000054 [Herbaspirillum rubrisubalbicans]|uniref:Immunity 49 family protein n=1 Tax=Herbaspirillum rubrisubalbicans TaxID=80842 RepID=A0AAD0XEQ6_9BURK|nr:Imm49 family immunity protein [Herbaspirillum rubrisubalbicans]AYR22687.1 hypothetical protein RC54_02120 [Herbaspirillum rubrisubalbicans]MCP1571675.1 hypothetical protein [Herbaspirillum rubrisubalbicans]